MDHLFPNNQLKSWFRKKDFTKSELIMDIIKALLLIPIALMFGSIIILVSLAGLITIIILFGVVIWA